MSVRTVEKQSGRAFGWVSRLAATEHGLPERGFMWVAAVRTGKCLSGVSPDGDTAEAYLDEALGELNANPVRAR